MDQLPRKLKILGTFVAAQLIFGSAHAECITAGVVETLQGEVFFRQSENSSWQPASLKHTLCEQDQLRTSALSRASIRLNNDTLIQLDQKTTLTLTDIGKEQEKSFLDLIEGLIHTLSRVPRSLEIRTPYVNASIEGTEFVVHKDEANGRVSVIEGKVKAYNDSGEVMLTANEAAQSHQGGSPSKSLMINPLKGVAWEIRYLPITSLNSSELSPAEKRAWSHYQDHRPDLAIQELRTAEPDSTETSDQALLLLAVSHLALGRDAATREILDQLPKSDPSTHALRSVIAIAQNRLNDAAQHLGKAQQLAPEAEDVLLAQSYFQQASQRTTEALESAKQAYSRAPNNPLIAARYSELLLMTGHNGKAETVAEKALLNAPQHDALMTSLGFAQLHNGKTDQAKKTFEKALNKHSTNSLNHLGLGLSKVKQGQLESGREHLETAVLLSPTYSLLRSYLAKAYFEEIRNPLVYDQLDLAKQEDPADPTPWFYEAITLRDDNRTIEALKSMEQSIALNENRAVYRSQLLLDDDYASRSAALSNILAALGFEQEAITPSSLALAQAPNNAAAHRQLADAYSGRNDLGLARTNELLQAQVYAPLGQKLIPAQTLLNTSRLLHEGGPLSGGHKELNSLFQKVGTYANSLLKVGSQDTLEGEVTTGYMGHSSALQASLYHMETDGEDGELHSYETDVASLGLQWQIKPSVQLKLNHNSSDTTKGQISQRFLEATITPDYQSGYDFESNAIATNIRVSPNNQWTGKVSRSTLEFSREFQPIPGLLVDTLDDIATDRISIQNLFKTRNHRFLSGLERAEYNNKGHWKNSAGGGSSWDSDHSQNSIYGYWYSELPGKPIQWTLGLQFTGQNASISDKDRDELLPKLGLQWKTASNTQMALAWFRSMSDVYAHRYSETLAPTQVAGFNQITSGIEQELGANTGLSIEHTFSDSVSSGLRLTYREGESFQVIGASPFSPARNVNVETTSKKAIAWGHWAISNRLSLGLEHHFEDLHDGWEDKLGISMDGLEKLSTHRTPITLSYDHNSRVSAKLINTYIQQDGVFWTGGTPVEPTTVIKGSDEFWITDASVSYVLPKRRGKLTVGVKNLFDQDFRYEDSSSFDLQLPDETWVPSNYVREQFWFASLAFRFR